MFKTTRQTGGFTMDALDTLRAHKARLGATPVRFDVITITGKPGNTYSVDAVHAPQKGLWQSVTACLIDDITGQQCGDMEVIDISQITAIHHS